MYTHTQSLNSNLSASTTFVGNESDADESLFKLKLLKPAAAVFSISFCSSTSLSMSSPEKPKVNVDVIVENISDRNCSNWRRGEKVKGWMIRYETRALSDRTGEKNFFFIMEREIGRKKERIM